MIIVNTTIPTTEVVPEIPSWKNQIIMGWDTIRPAQIWNQYADIPPAPTEEDAQAAAAALSGIIENRTASGIVVHLTPTGEENVYFATDTYGDLSTRLCNWISPRFVPRTDGEYNGLPSLGYIARLYNGNPVSGGVEIPDMADETGYIPRWNMNYGFGAVSIVLASDEVIDEEDLWITGYRYIGMAGQGLSGVL